MFGHRDEEKPKADEKSPEAPKQKEPEKPKAEAKPEPKGRKVQIHGSTQHGDVVTVHATVEGERRVHRLHRQELERWSDPEERRKAVALQFVGARPPEDGDIGDPYEIRGVVRV